jgi:hypothetical protein
MELEYNELNDDWIHHFEKTEKIYEDFYKDDLYYTNVKIMYINKNNEIEKIKHDTFLMTVSNYISREDILDILKRNAIDNDTRYKLLSILRYNITLESEDIKSFLQDSLQESFLFTHKHIDAIQFEKSIHMFHDLNDVFFLFYETSNELKESDPHNTTKKIYLNLGLPTRSHKKTLKKRYKE